MTELTITDASKQFGIGNTRQITVTPRLHSSADNIEAWVSVRDIHKGGKFEQNGAARKP